MKIQASILIIFAIAIIGGCKSSTTVVDSYTGTFEGKLALLAVNANPLPQQGGATIQIQGTPFSATTDTSGAWHIDNVPAGIYNIIEMKAGFDTTIISQYQFSGAGTSFLEHDAIEQIPFDSISFVARLVFNSGDSANAPDSNATLYISGHASGTDSLKQFLLMVNKDSTRSVMENSSTLYYPSLIMTLSVVGANRLISDTLSQYNGFFYGNSIKSGDTLYVRTTAVGNEFSKSYDDIYDSQSGQTESPYSVVQRIIVP